MLCTEVEHFLDHVDNFLDGKTLLNIDYWYMRLNKALSAEYMPGQKMFRGGRPLGSADLRKRKSRKKRAPP